MRYCNHSPAVLGNLRREHFLDIFYNHPHVAAFQRTRPAECAHCPEEIYEVCQGGCPAAAEQCYGTLQRGDPYVTLYGKQFSPAAPA